jgi:hypothetical protein
MQTPFDFSHKFDGGNFGQVGGHGGTGQAGTGRECTAPAPRAPVLPPPTASLIANAILHALTGLLY